MTLKVYITNLENDGYGCGNYCNKQVVKVLNTYYVLVACTDQGLLFYYGSDPTNLALAGTIYDSGANAGALTSDMNYSKSRNSLGINYATYTAYHYFREITLAQDGTPTIGSQVTVMSNSTYNRAGTGTWGANDTYWAGTSYPYWVHLFYGLTSFTQRWRSSKSYGYTRVDMTMTHLGDNRVVIVYHGYNNNNLYFADMDIDTTYKADADTGLDTDAGARYMSSMQITYHPSVGKVYFCFRRSADVGIATYDPSTQTFSLKTTIAVAPQYNNGLACALDADGKLHILVLDANNTAYIRYYTYDGTTVTHVDDIVVPSGYGTYWKWLSKLHYYGGDGTSQSLTALARTDTGRLVIIEIVLKVAYSLELSDTVLDIDYLRLAPCKTFTDTASSADLYKLVLGKTFKETTYTYERFKRSSSKIFWEYVYPEYILSIIRGKIVKDLSKVLDRLARKAVFYRSFTDSSRVFDYKKLLTYKKLKEISTSTDRLTKLVSKIYVDVGKAIDRFAKEPSKRFVDASYSYDRLVLGTTKSFVELAIPCDYVSLESVKVYRDVSNVYEKVSKTASKEFTDYSKAIDLKLVRGVCKLFKEPVATIDMLSKEMLKVYRDLSKTYDKFSMLMAKELIDVSKVIDMFTKIVEYYRVFTDLGYVADYSRLSTVKPIQELVTTYEKTAVGTTKTGMDASKALDYLKLSSEKRLVELIPIYDCISKLISKYYSDAVLTYEKLNIVPSIYLKEVIYPDYLLSKESTKHYAEKSYVSDIIYKTFGKTFKDVSYITDYHKLLLTKVFRELTYSIDVIYKELIKTYLDLSTVSDYVKLATLKRLLDAVLTKELFSKTAVFYRSFIDLTLVSDYKAFNLSKPFKDASLLTDYLRLLTAKALVESVTGYDRIAKLITSVVADESIVTDFLYITRLVTLKDLVYPEFYICRELSKQFLDASLISDYIYTYLGKILRDSSLVSDYLRIASVKELLDTSLISDFIEYSKYFYRVLRDVVFPDFVVGKTMIKRFFDVSTITDVATRVLSKYLLDEAFVSDVLEKFVTHLVSVLDRVYPEYVISRYGIFHKYDIAKIVEVFVTWALWLYGYELRRMRVGDIIRPEDFNNPLYVAMKESDECKQLWSAVNPGKPYPDSINKLDDTLASLSPVSRGDYVLAEHINTLLDTCLYIYETLRDIYNDYIDKLGGSRDPEIEHYLDLMKSILTSPKFAYAGEWIYPDYFLQVYELLIYGHYVITLLKPKLGIK